MDCVELNRILSTEESCELTDSGWRVLTQCMHASFEPAAVYVTGYGDGYFVSDGGDAASVSLRHGREEVLIHAALKEATEKFGLTLDKGVIGAKVPDADWLRAAVLAVANASASASREAVATIAARQEKRLTDQILEALRRTAMPQNIATGYKYRGNSGRLWQVDFAVFGGPRPLLLKGITAHHSSLAASYTAFGDIKETGEETDRFAVCDDALDAEDSALMRQVAEIVPLHAVEAGARRALA